jgi:hypothetical protein
LIVGVYDSRRWDLRYFHVLYMLSDVGSAYQFREGKVGRGEHMDGIIIIKRNYL